MKNIIALSLLIGTASVQAAQVTTADTNLAIGINNILANFERTTAEMAASSNIVAGQSNTVFTDAVTQTQVANQPQVSSNEAVTVQQNPFLQVVANGNVEPKEVAESQPEQATQIGQAGIRYIDG